MSTYGPIEKEYRRKMNNVAKALAKRFKGLGFTLLVFEFGDKPGARVNYISNAERSTMITAMKEFIACAEGMDPPDSNTTH